jgi:phenylpropionate dioxygenase-like ring-hydroxylating dioxygenase large terminal subunit
MFINTEHLPQILQASDYTSHGQFEREVTHLFEPAWHFVATTTDLPNHGDYITRELLGRPIILWNHHGTVHGFLNVCPHRFSRISGKAHGCAPDRLKCQYHGWEFDETGGTRKIPDAPSFKPMVQGELGLKKYRTETCGQLVFVNLSDEGPSLTEYLGELAPFVEEYCSENKNPAASFVFEYDVNWKIKIENSLESYHLDEVHQRSFGRTPPAAVCSHELKPGWSCFRTSQGPATKMQQWLDRFALRKARLEDAPAFEHYILHPHFIFGRARLMSFAETVYPVSPTRTVNLMKLFSHKSRSGKLTSRALCRFLAAFGKRYFYKVALEDIPIIHEVQRGLESSSRPSRGLISTREERCFHFQEWVKQRTEPEPVESKDNRKRSGRARRLARHRRQDSSQWCEQKAEAPTERRTESKARSRTVPLSGGEGI